jgi:hypothetical protein
MLEERAMIPAARGVHDMRRIVSRASAVYSAALRVVQAAYRIADAVTLAPHPPGEVHGRAPGRAERDALATALHDLAGAEWHLDEVPTTGDEDHVVDRVRDAARLVGDIARMQGRICQHWLDGEAGTAEGES